MASGSSYADVTKSGFTLTERSQEYNIWSQILLESWGDITKNLRNLNEIASQLWRDGTLSSNEAADARRLGTGHLLHILQCKGAEGFAYFLGALKTHNETLFRKLSKKVDVAKTSMLEKDVFAAQEAAQQNVVTAFSSDKPLLTIPGYLEIYHETIREERAFITENIQCPGLLEKELKREHSWNSPNPQRSDIIVDYILTTGFDEYSKFIETLQRHEDKVYSMLLQSIKTKIQKHEQEVLLETKKQPEQSTDTQGSCLKMDGTTGEDCQVDGSSAGVPMQTIRNILSEEYGYVVKGMKYPISIAHALDKEGYIPSGSVETMEEMKNTEASSKYLLDSILKSEVHILVPFMEALKQSKNRDVYTHLKKKIYQRKEPEESASIVPDLAESITKEQSVPQV